MIKNKLIFLLVLFFTTLFLLGCTGTSSAICGDGICSPGEELTCPTDCAVKVDGDVIVSINGAYDADGEIYLYWYHSKDVYANISQNLTSRLGDNWYGSTNKNLHISFNDSSSGSIPVEKYGNRQVVLSNLEQGEYYFEARTTDYAYRAVSEKIIVKENGDKYVNLTLSPSNPAVRIKAVDEMGRSLTGEGTIELYYVEESWHNGQYETYEGLYNSMYFNSDEEMNALFYVWQPSPMDNKNVYYKVVINKKGYEFDTRQIWGSMYYKYTEYNFVLRNSTPIKTGNLEINIVAGNERSDYSSQMFLLEGKEVQICKTSNWSCESVILNSDLKINLENKAYGDYAIQLGFGDFNSNEIPYTINETVTIDSENAVTEVKARRGSLLRISVLDADRQLINSSQVKVYSICYFSSINQGTNCYDYNGITWEELFGVNPYSASQGLYSASDLENLLSYIYTIRLEFNGQVKDFNFPLFRQGYNTQRFGFDSVDSAPTMLKVGESILVDGGTDFNGQSLTLVLVDVYETQQSAFFESKFELKSDDIVIKIVNAQAPSDLKDIFGNNYIKNSILLKDVAYDVVDQFYYVNLNIIN